MSVSCECIMFGKRTGPISLSVYHEVDVFV